MDSTKDQINHSTATDGKPPVSGSIDVPPTRVRFWRNIHDDTTVAYGSVIDQTETHYIVVPDDDVRPTVKWSKDRCDVLR